MLDGKRLLITGVLTRKSIVAVAHEAQLAGAEVVLDGVRPLPADDRIQRRAFPRPPT